MIWAEFKAAVERRDRHLTGIIFLYDISETRTGSTMARVSVHPTSMLCQVVPVVLT